MTGSWGFMPSSLSNTGKWREGPRHRRPPAAMRATFTARPVALVHRPWHGGHLSFFSQLTYRDWLQLEIEIQPEVDSLSDTER